MTEELPDIIDKNFSGKFLSFVIPSKNAERLKPFLDHLQDSCFDHRNFEVNVAIDDNTQIEEDLKLLILDYPFEIKYIKTNYGYFKNNSNSNDLIFNCSDQNTYFIIHLSDRYRFSCKHWDLLIKTYIKTVPDDMFFLRTAKYSKNLKTRRSVHKAFTTNETWGIYSRKLLQTVGGFPEYLAAHDCGFEMLYFFISNNKKDLFRRDIVIPNILSTNAVVASTATGLEYFYQRSLKGFLMIRRSFFTKEVFEKLKCSASRVYLNYMIHKRKIDGKIEEDEKKKICFIRTKNGKKIRKTSYKISYFFAFKQNLISKYRSVNFEVFVIAFYPLLRRKWGYNLVLHLINSENFFQKFLLLVLRLIFGCGETKFTDHLDTKEMRNVLQSKEFINAYDDNFGKEFWKEFIKK
jgi:hypothetical protein